jgi:hypothetical protein
MGKETKKHWSEKFTNEMDFEEFVKWAQSFVLEQFLESGLKGIKQGIWTVCDQAARNKTFNERFPKQ